MNAAINLQEVGKRMNFNNLISSFDGNQPVNMDQSNPQIIKEMKGE